jgi:C4-dicarboxylate transporter, DcuC family
MDPSCATTSIRPRRTNVIWLSVAVVIAAIVLMARRVEVRIVLLGAGVVLAVLAGTPLLVADTFTKAMVAAMVAPICASMGFAALIARTGCDRALIRVLVAPIRRVPILALPGGIIAAYVVNLAVPSQSSTAAALGPILVPLLRAGGVSAEVAGAALLLGASFGGDLLNPGAQDVQAIAGVTRADAARMSQLLVQSSIAGLLVAAVVFAWWSRRRSTAPLVEEPTVRDAEEPVQWLRAVVPIVPVALLLAAYSGWKPLDWLVSVPEGESWKPLGGALPVVRAMLIGALCAAVFAWRDVRELATTMFDGMGKAYGSIISLTITAQVFGAGIGASGIAAALLVLSEGSGALGALSAAFPWGLSMLSGSGSGPILAFAQAFLAPLGNDARVTDYAALACAGGAFGRTLSPVSAVTVYCAGLVGVSPVQLVKTVAVPLLVGAAVMIGMIVVS